MEVVSVSKTHRSPESDRAPRSVVHDAYQHCTQARSLWGGFAAEMSNRPREREDAHRHLNGATLYYYNVLKPYLSTAASGTVARDLWANAPLWPLKQATETLDAVVCRQESCGAVYERGADARLEPGAECPACGLPLEPDEIEVAVTDENGREQMEWLTGLKHIQKFADETVTVQVDAGKWSNDTETKEIAKRLEPEVLLRLAGYLDEAASDLGLLAAVDDERPETEV